MRVREHSGVQAGERIDMTVAVVAAYVTGNSVPVSDLPSLIVDTHAAFTRLAAENVVATPGLDVLTPDRIRASIRPEALISFENGKAYKTLKRHLTSEGLTPLTYRRKWGLPKDYPMTASNYSALRNSLAKSLAMELRHAVPITKNDRALDVR